MTDIATDAAPAAAPAAPAGPSHGQIESTPDTSMEGFDRNSISRLAHESADANDLSKALEAVAAKGEAITIADLRTVPGLEKYSDADIQAAWAELNAPKAAPAAAKPAAAAATPRSYKVYLDGKEVADVDKLTAAELFRAEYGYQANGKEQRKDLNGVFRNAQLGHYHAERMQTLTQNLNTALDNARKAQGEVTTLTGLKTTWVKALDAAARQDFGPLQTMLDAYMTEINAAPLGAKPEVAAESDPQLHETGMQVYQNYVWPEADKLSKQYEGKWTPQQIAEAIMYKVQLEPPEFATPARLQQIVEIEIPQLLEDSARDTAPATVDDRDTKIAELTAQLAKVQGTTAEEHNKRVADTHARRKAAPPSHSSAPGPAGALESPDFGSAEEAKQWLRKLKV